MRRIWLLMVLGLAWCFPVEAYPEEPVRVIVLPFDVYASEDLGYLATQIPKVLGDQLKAAGAVVLIPESRPLQSLIENRGNAEALRRRGLEMGADYVMWGSFTLLGKAYSIDVYLLKTTGSEPALSLYTEDLGMENLLSSVSTIGRDVELKIFRREKVARVVIKGNQRIESEAILRRIKTGTGDVYLAKNLAEDLRAIYQMGYFEDIRVESEVSPEGKVVIFTVTEKPTIRVIRVKGAKRGYKEKDIKENLDIKTGSILNIFNLQKNVQRIENLYKEKNFHNVEVTYEVLPKDNNQADIIFNIKEGAKARIRKIAFEGNEAFSDKKLKKTIRTSEKGFLSFIFGSGELNREDLEQDVAMLTAYYQNHGYIRARVGDPVVDFKDEWIYITFKIMEGERFSTGNVTIVGDLIKPKEELMKQVKITREEFYSREVVRNDVLKIKEIYSDEGYAYADVFPRIKQNPETLEVDIAYTIDKGSLVYFERIIIGGNTRTRDKVIRRELNVYEQELFSGRRMKRGVANLYRLDYFEDVKVKTSKGSADNLMILNLDVTEKSTGQFVFGGGYSSTENFFVTASIAQRNLFGRGQRLQFKGELGGRTTRFSLSFTEPWLFDIPLAAGGDIYSWLFSYDQYDKDSFGGLARFSYPVWAYTRAYVAYGYDISDVKNISDGAVRSIKELEGVNTTSSITGELRYESRDRPFNPSKGSSHSGSIEYAGGLLGGDVGFTKVMAETGWVVPFFFNHTWFFHAEVGHVSQNGDQLLPDYEKFYLGGMNSVRGFDFQGIFAVDEDGNKIGGNSYVQGNIEYRLPLVESAGLVGVLFLDVGQVYGEQDPVGGPLRESAGLGIRWFSPVGPIRLEYGFILDPLPNEPTGGQFQFSMGSAF